MSKLISTIIIIGFPIAIFIVSYFASPDYFAPMFSQPLGIIMLVGSVIWLLIGAFVLLITNGWTRRFATVLFTTPVILMTMLGPAILTIMSAPGPIVESSESSSDSTTTTTTTQTANPTSTKTDTTNGAKKSKVQE